MTRIVVVLCGPPGAGKTTAARRSGLTVYDRDDDQWSTERDFGSAIARLAHDPRARAVVIRSGASSSARARAAARTGATHVFLLTADPQELRRRVASRDRADSRRALAGVGHWHADFDRDDGVPDFPGWDRVFPGAALHLGPSTLPHW